MSLDGSDFDGMEGLNENEIQLGEEVANNEDNGFDDEAASSNHGGPRGPRGPRVHGVHGVHGAHEGQSCMGRGRGRGKAAAKSSVVMCMVCELKPVLSGRLKTKYCNDCNKRGGPSSSRT